jgi:hypothetical protein
MVDKRMWQLYKKRQWVAILHDVFLDLVGNMMMKVQANIWVPLGSSPSAGYERFSVRLSFDWQSSRGQMSMKHLSELIGKHATSKLLEQDDEWNAAEHLRWALKVNGDMVDRNTGESLF